MNDRDDPLPHQRCIDVAAKAGFLADLRRGARREDAAADAGFSLMGFYGARRRDPAFKSAWEEALGELPAAQRRERAYAERDACIEKSRWACPERSRGEVRIAAANRRFWQRRRRSHVRFIAERQADFLTHFASSCDARAAAAAAGVSESTVHLRRRTDPVFAEAYAQALQEGYARLETEMLRQRLAAQARLREAIEAAGPAAPLPAEEGAEFDRIMKILARHDRKPRRVERGFRSGGQRQRMSFDEAIVLLDRKLRAMGVRRSGVSLGDKTE